MVAGSPNPDLVHEGPDLFGYYKHEITHLLTQQDNFPFSYSSSSLNRRTPDVSSSSSSCLFSNSLEGSVPLFQRDLLRSSLRQGASALSQEVDEISDTVIRFRHALDCVNFKLKQTFDVKDLVNGDLDSAPPRCKKQKTISSNGDEDLIFDQRAATKKEREADEALKTLLRGEPGLVEETMMKYSDQYYAMLNHMEKQLEELLNALVSKCRLMTYQEMQQLRKLIQELPTRNLDRIVEIIHHGKSGDAVLSEEILIDLEGQDNATLWRLYFYTKAVKNAKKLAA